MGRYLSVAALSCRRAFGKRAGLRNGEAPGGRTEFGSSRLGCKGAEPALPGSQPQHGVTSLLPRTSRRSGFVRPAILCLITCAKQGSNPLAAAASPGAPLSRTGYSTHLNSLPVGSSFLSCTYMGGCKCGESVLRFLVLLFLQSLILIKVRSALWPTSKSAVIIALYLMTRTCPNRPNAAQTAGRGHLPGQPRQGDSVLINHRDVLSKHQKCAAPQRDQARRNRLSVFLNL